MEKEMKQIEHYTKGNISQKIRPMFTNVNRIIGEPDSLEKSAFLTKWIGQLERELVGLGIETK